MVWRLEDLGKVDPKINVARIAHTVGENKRMRILEAAKKASIRVLNPGPKKPAEPTAAEVTDETAAKEKTTEQETAEQETVEASGKGEEEE
jgi:ribosomal 50S subunit-recycling heat shock protein